MLPLRSVRPFVVDGKKGEISWSELLDAEENEDMEPWRSRSGDRDGEADAEAGAEVDICDRRLCRVSCCEWRRRYF